MTEQSSAVLNEIILNDLEAISTMEVASEDRAHAIDDVERLIRVSIDSQDAETKAEKEKEMVKNDKRKMWIDNGTRLIGYAAGFGGTILAIVADRNGWFVSKLGMQSSLKPKI